MEYESLKISEKELHRYSHLQLTVIYWAILFYPNEVLFSKPFEDFSCNFKRLKTVGNETDYVLSNLVQNYLVRDPKRFKQMYTLCYKLVKNKVPREGLIDSRATKALLIAPISRETKEEADTSRSVSLKTKKTKSKKPLISLEKEFNHFAYSHKETVVILAHHFWKQRNSDDDYKKVFDKPYFNREFENLNDLMEAMDYFEDLYVNYPYKLNSIYEHCWRAVRQIIKDKRISKDYTEEDLKKQYRLN